MAEIHELRPGKTATIKLKDSHGNEHRLPVLIRHVKGLSLDANDASKTYSGLMGSVQQSAPSVMQESARVVKGAPRLNTGGALGSLVINRDTAKYFDL